MFLLLLSLNAMERIKNNSDEIAMNAIKLFYKCCPLWHGLIVIHNLEDSDQLKSTR